MTDTTTNATIYTATFATDPIHGQTGTSTDIYLHGFHLTVRYADPSGWSTTNKEFIISSEIAGITMPNGSTV